MAADDINNPDALEDNKDQGTQIDSPVSNQGTQIDRPVSNQGTQIDRPFGNQATQTSDPAGNQVTQTGAPDRPYSTSLDNQDNTGDLPSYKSPTEGPEVKSGEDYMTAETSVLGQLDKILAEDSPYIKRAKALGREQAASLGMLSSSMAGGAAAGAAIDRGGELAAKEADIAAGFKMQQQSAENAQAQTQWEGLVSGELNKQEAAIQERQQRINNLFQAGENEKERGLKKELQASEQEWQENLKKWEVETNQTFEKAKLNQTLSAEEEQIARSHVNQLIENHQIAMETMLSNTALLDLGTEAMTAAINTLRNQTMGALKFAVKGTALQKDMAPFFAQLFDDWTFGGGGGGQGSSTVQASYVPAKNTGFGS